ncbi:MAG: HPr family phosphocarrier protein [Clostridia bacterium]|nr:HPr family phosphocarrier protein [Clostridia bacterium]MBP3378340.1 HPr family phosphocarrier protein [Clostridia bacterium]
MEKITYKITDKNGIHARPAGLIVQAAKQFSSSVTLTCKGKQADCKKLFQLMQTGVKSGDEIEISADGEDAASAVAEIERTMKKAGL